METIDRIILGDNQFFGINHMSQEKAMLLSERFSNIDMIFRQYHIAYETGVKAYMLNSHTQASDICRYFIRNKTEFRDTVWYPSIPYAYKYANLVAEKGIVPAINEVLFSNNSLDGISGLITKGALALLTKDAIKLMQMLIDIEMRSFKGLNIKVIFLQNIITDLLLGFGVKDVFYEFCEHVRKKYHCMPGLITQNMPYLKARLEDWELKDLVICTSFNKIGYLMSPDIESYVSAASSNDSSRYQIIAMSVLASGAVKATEAYDFINKQNVQSVVFGASNREHIQEALELIRH
jgi:hypothetical protein